MYASVSLQRQKSKYSKLLSTKVIIKNETFICSRGNSCPPPCGAAFHVHRDENPCTRMTHFLWFLFFPPEFCQFSLCTTARLAQTHTSSLNNSVLPAL